MNLQIVNVVRMKMPNISNLHPNDELLQFNDIAFVDTNLISWETNIFQVM
jgi:hypothetical protein